MKSLHILLLGLLAVMLVACNNDNAELTDQERAALEAEEQRIADSTAAAEEAEEAARFRWSYDKTEDAMGAKDITATVISTNKVDLDFPYQGEQRGTLIIRNHSKDGKSILFTLKEGQIVNDMVMLRFNDEEAESVSYFQPAEGGSNVIYLNGYDNLINKFAAADKVAVQVHINDQGSHIFEFDVSGFDHAKLK